MKQLPKLSPIQHQEGDWPGQLKDRAGWRVVQQVHSVDEEVVAAREKVAICDQSHRGKLRIEGKAAAAILSATDLAIHAGKKTEFGNLYKLRPDLFFLSTTSENEEGAEDWLQAKKQETGSLVSVTNVTHGNGEIWLLGSRSAHLLGRLCSLDFHDDYFPDSSAKQSSVAKTRQLIIRQDIGDVLVYALIGDRSLANYLWHTIIKAGNDLRIQHIGEQTVEKLGAE
jgi:heterotetrameric sarcosine oxidase gamma subunit